MLEKIFKRVNPIHWNWFRHCAVCESSLPPIEWLCARCLKQLKSLFISPVYMTRMQSHVRHIRLVDWTHQNHYFIQTLLNRLKGFQYSHFFSLFAFEFFTRIIQLPSVMKEKPFALIPCPARKTNHPLWKFLDSSMQNILSQNIKTNQCTIKDHSYYWAEALQKLTQSPVCPVLSLPFSDSSQKEKNLLERKQRTFLVKDESHIPANHHIVFVDDVVTSGSTAMGVYKALGQPKNFMIWSIFWKK